LKVSEPGGRVSTSVRINRIEKHYGRLQALNRVSLEIREKEFFTLLGPSGCGKTTLLRSIAGFEQPDGGSILFNQREVTRVPPWEKNIGFVFQNYALWPNKTVFQNVSYGLELRKKSAGYIREKVEWALELVGLGGIGKKYPEEMSGGQQQRVAIARALVIDPEILLLDEPLSNLDAKLRISLRKQIREIQRELGLTAVYVTHDQEEALEISDRIAVMNRGEVLQVGTPEEIYDRPSDRFVADFIGKANFLAGGISGGRFSLPSGLHLPLDVKGRPEGPAVLFSRPESLERTGADVPGAFPGKVVQKFYLGNLKRYFVELDPETRILWETGEGLREGEIIHLKVNSYDFFDTQN